MRQAATRTHKLYVFSWKPPVDPTEYFIYAARRRELRLRSVRAHCTGLLCSLLLLVWRYICILYAYWALNDATQILHWKGMADCHRHMHENAKKHKYTRKTNTLVPRWKSSWYISTTKKAKTFRFSSEKWEHRKFWRAKQLLSTLKQIFDARYTRDEELFACYK